MPKLCVLALCAGDAFLCTVYGVVLVIDVLELELELRHGHDLYILGLRETAVVGTG